MVSENRLKLTDVTDRIRVAPETRYQELINVEATATGELKLKISKLRAVLNTGVAQFRDGPLSALKFPDVFLDATHCKARVNHRIVSQAVRVAADGRREVIGTVFQGS